MDFLQSLLRGFDVCEGFLEVMTLLLDVAAVYLGVLTYQKHKHANEKLAHDPRAHIKKPSWWPCIIMLSIATALTALVVCKWTLVRR